MSRVCRERIPLEHACSTFHCTIMTNVIEPIQVQYIVQLTIRYHFILKPHSITIQTAILEFLAPLFTWWIKWCKNMSNFLTRVNHTYWKNMISTHVTLILMLLNKILFYNWSLRETETRKRYTLYTIQYLDKCSFMLLIKNESIMRKF